MPASDSPPTTLRKPMAPRPTFDRPIAHRGLHSRAAGVIENSRSAFEAAIARGFAVECDVQLSRDGVPVVFHDYDLERLTGLKGSVGTRTAAELTATPLLGSSSGDTPMLLDHFLRLIDGRTLLQLELKHQPTPQMAETLARRAAEAIAGYTGPVTVMSFDPNLLMLVRRHGYRGPLGIITNRYDEPEWEKMSRRDRVILRHLLHWPWTRFSFISCFHKSLDLPMVRFFRSLGVPVTTWTIRSPEERRAVARAADQIVFEGFDPEVA
jgi:glycerophosphoryl diester phosphodiesterase